MAIHSFQFAVGRGFTQAFVVKVYVMLLEFALPRFPLGKGPRQPLSRVFLRVLFRHAQLAIVVLSLQARSTRELELGGLSIFLVPELVSILLLYGADLVKR